MEQKRRNITTVFCTRIRRGVVLIETVTYMFAYVICYMFEPKFFSLLVIGSY